MQGRNETLMPGMGVRRSKATASSVENAVGHKKMLLLIQLRWVAVVGQLTTIAIVWHFYLVDLPLQQMLTVLACLALFNIGSYLRWHKQRPVSNYELFFALLVDVASLTAQLYFSGGLTNPYAFLYLLQVILSAVMLEAWSTWTIVAITSTCLAGLSLFSKPLDLPLDHVLGLFSPYIQGMLICFVLNAVLLVIFITSIHRNVRTADAQLADLRQNAAEEEHIVRMGLLASGAAHELGTPLATMSVILGDWKRVPELAEDEDLREEIDIMQTQLQRCKAIVSGILLSAGEMRGEELERTTVVTFLDKLAEEWRATRQAEKFVYNNLIREDLPVVFDSAIKQTLHNLLDNALEASPHWLKLEAWREEGFLILQVSDAGPGFTEAMLSQFGKPYQSTKGRPGSGLGLFLAVNVVRTLGGTLAARNLPQGGAEVAVRLPLNSIALEERKPDAA
jgi:two-component system, sensor histidine kinase RegB